MMQRTLFRIALALLPVATIPFPVLAADVVTALKVDKAPNPAVGTADPAWSQAKALTVSLAGGKNFKDGKTTATIKAVYFGDMFYMLVQYDDPTQSVRRFPYQKQPDGSWKKLVDPNDKGGDDNLYYEDKFALIWNIGNSIKNFTTLGCMAACHVGEPGKPYGNKYTASEGELGDIWHMKSIRTGYIGQVDDQYLDHTRFDKDKAPEAGRKSDPKTAGGYDDIKLVNGKPEFMHKSGMAANKGGTYYLKAEDKVPFDDSKFQPGDEVASILVAPFTGDRGEIAVHINWADGKWTTVLSRKLVTGSNYGVQFDNLDGTYEFGLAAFDNAQVRHAFQVGALQLKFAK
jgi:Ethylbenzene dehydrogenase